jgi:hypothetical protein
MNPFNKSIALAAALAAVTIAGCSGGSGAKSGDTAGPVGNAKFSVSTEATQAQINHLTLTIGAGAVSGSNPAMTDIVVELTKSGAYQNQWTGALANIPAGTARLFKAAAYRNPGTAAADLVYYGETVANVSAGSTATVTLMLQEQNRAPGPTRYAPQLTSLTVSNSYVLPGTPVAIHATATDPDGQGNPLTYSISSVCDAGSGTFSPASGSGGAFDTTFLGPVVNATCQVALLVKETATAGNANTPLSVTTYFTVVVNANFGKVNVTAFPNSYPIISVLGDFRYNYFSDVTIMPVGQQADFHFTATDPDGDNMKFTLTTKCGTDLVNAATQPNLSSDYFWYLKGSTYVGHAMATDGTSFTTVGSPGVTPPSPYTAEWFPHFGGASDGFNFSDPTKDCIFTLTVNDLCTNGNCGSSGQGGLADGSVKTTTVGGVQVTSATIGVIDAVHPAMPNRAPAVEAVETVNQDGPSATGVQTWDPQKIAFVDINGTYNLSAAADDRWDGGSAPAAPTVAWSCNTGSLAHTEKAGTYAFGTVNVPDTTSNAVFTTGASVPPNAMCSATFTSPKTGLSTVVTFHFLKKDPCAINNLSNGTACSSGNLCLQNETCLNFVCQGGSAVVCPVNDGQCQTAICDPALGCGINNKANNTPCDQDHNGCTQNDFCQAGVCTQGAAINCNTPADPQCQSASGSCTTGGTLGNAGWAGANNTYSCAYVSFADGTQCDKDGSGCTQNDHCVLGACTVGTAVSCNTPADALCQNAPGSCVNGGSLGAGGFANNSYSCNYTPKPNGTSCAPELGLCYATQQCEAGVCTGSGSACQSGQSCNPADGSCKGSQVVATRALDVQTSPPGGLAMDTAGNTYLAGSFNLNVPVNFQTEVGQPAINIKSVGGYDVVVAKYNQAGAIQWAVDIGDDDLVSQNDQKATGAAVNNGNRVGIIGQMGGTVTFGANTILGAVTPHYVAALDGATGSRIWAKGFNLGGNGSFASIAASPNGASGRFAVCGVASMAATSLVPGATFGGGQDLVIAAFDSSGGLLWSKQIGGTGNENCRSIAVDDNGNVFAAGQFDGASITFPPLAAMTGPNATSRKFMWVVKFDGATGNALAQASFANSTPAATPISAFPDALAVDPSGNLLVGVHYSGTIEVPAGTALVSAGGDDALVMKLGVSGTALVPAWSGVRFGGTGIDLIKGIASTSFGDIVVVGTVNPSNGTFKAANGGFDTNGAVQLTVNGTTAPDQFIVKLNGQTGAADLPAGVTMVYGDTGTQNGDSIVVNKYSVVPSARDAMTFGGTLTGTVNYNGTYGAAGSVSATNAADQSLVFGALQFH